jgi:tetratricopeptide (TPR) repeat protein
MSFLLAFVLGAAAQNNTAVSADAQTNTVANAAAQTNIAVEAAAQTQMAGVGAADSNLAEAPDWGDLTSSNLLQPANASNAQEAADFYFQTQMDLAIRQRHDKSPALAAQTLITILETNAAPEFKRKALFELALAEQDNNNFVKAQQVFAQYLQRYPEDPSAPEVLLRQGLLYRQMGVNTMAIGKFYTVMSTALKLRLDNNGADYYKRLVLQAQTEIADTYYIQGQFNESADFYARLLKADSPSLNKQQIEFNLIRSLSYLTNQTETIAGAERFLERFPDYSDVPEVRFILASAYTTVGRNSDASKQVLLLLQSQQENARRNPELWVYWQRKAGNEIANQLFKEADYLDALQIYQNLAALDPAPAWQAPALYQVGLVYEQLQQWEKATDTYGQILARRVELTGSNAPPSLSSLCEMAQWRKDYIAWLQKARAANQDFQQSDLYQPPTTNTNVTAAK